MWYSNFFKYAISIDNLNKKPILAIVHASMFNNFPLDDILCWARKNNLTIVNIGLNHEDVLNEDDILEAHPYYAYQMMDGGYLDILKGETVILVGGYRSLCVRAIKNILDGLGCDVYFIEDWIVSDPDFYLNLLPEDRFKGYVKGDFNKLDKKEQGKQLSIGWRPSQEIYTPDFREIFEIDENRKVEK